jgi:hypothetical protein
MQHLRELAEQNGIAFRTSPMDALRQSIDALTRALGGVPPAFDAIRNAAQQASRPLEIPVRFRMPEGGGPFRDFPSIPEFRHGGIIGGDVYIPRAAQGLMVPSRPGGQLFVAGEGGDSEVVAPVRALFGSLGDSIASKVAAAVSGAMTVIVPVNIDGQQIDKLIVRRGRAGLIPVQMKGQFGGY